MALQRLLSAVQLPANVFELLTSTGAPLVSSRELGTSIFSLPTADMLKSGEALQAALAHQMQSPPCLSFRLNTLARGHGVDVDIDSAIESLRAVTSARASIQRHSLWPDVITLQTSPPSGAAPEPCYPTVLTSARCGEAVLRGRSLLEMPDISATILDKSKLRRGSRVSVFAAGRSCQIHEHQARSPTSGASSTFEQGGSEKLEDVVERLVHRRHPKGVLGPYTEAVFLGNGVWLPPRGVRMTMGFIWPMNLRDPLEKNQGRPEKKRGTTKMAEDLGGILPQGLMPQSAPSAGTVHILSPKPGERILDLCAAPGGKTHHIAQLMCNQGSIVAVDCNRNRLVRMERFLGASGASIVQCVHADGMSWRPDAQEGLFDRVLVDAPCSASGLWPRLDWHRLDEAGIHALIQQQVALIATAVDAAKVGGVIVYSVCSYLPQETRDVVLHALAELPLELDTMADAVPGRNDPASCQDADAMGFFIARFRRLPGQTMVSKRQSSRRVNRAKSSS